jgi:hypothetical protein
MLFLHDGGLWRPAFGPCKDFLWLMGLALVLAVFDCAPNIHPRRNRALSAGGTAAPMMSGNWRPRYFALTRAYQ